MVDNRRAESIIRLSHAYLLLVYLDIDVSGKAEKNPSEKQEYALSLYRKVIHPNTSWFKHYLPLVNIRLSLIFLGSLVGLLRTDSEWDLFSKHVSINKTWEITFKEKNNISNPSLKNILLVFRNAVAHTDKNLVTIDESIDESVPRYIEHGVTFKSNQMTLTFTRSGYVQFAKDLVQASWQFGQKLLLEFNSTEA